ncbi:MAG: single-stranded DNA-binding protein [Deltaproteobacteria bacterium]|nr:single-stranded DNA-binding protein [Deltaproteobacteria bacterium]
MMDFNKVILLGHIGNDPELKKSAAGKPYLKLSLATNSLRKTASGGAEKTTHWHRVMVFGSQAEVCATYLRKGSPILLEGMIEVRTYNDKDGKKVSLHSVLANRVQFLGGRQHADVKEDVGEAEAGDVGSSEDLAESA